jgi:WD40 repeat protein
MAVSDPVESVGVALGRWARGVRRAGGFFLAVRGKLLRPFSTWVTPENAKGFRACRSPHPAADDFIHGLLALAAAVSAPSSLAAAAPDPAAAVSYFRDVRPILQARCQGCHQPAKAEGGYVMTEVPRLFSAGDSGTAGVVAGKPDESHLLAQITPDAAGGAEMPKGAAALATAEIALIRRWIVEGAQDDTPPSAGQRVDAEHPPVYTRQPVVTSLDFSPDGSRLAVAGFHEVLVFDVAALRDAAGGVPAPAMRLIGLSERIERVRFAPDGSRLLVTGGNPSRMGEVQIWSMADGTLVRSIPVTFDTVYGGCWSPDGKLVAFGCTDNSVRAVAVDTGEQVLFQGAHEDWALDTVFAPQGDHVISVGRDMTVKLTELATQRFVDNITSITPGALRGGLAAVDRHPSLEHVVAAGSDGTPRAYRIHRHAKRVIGDDANLIFPLHSVTGRVAAVRFSPDGRRVAAVGGVDGRGELVVSSYDLEADVPQPVLDIMAKVPGETRRKGSQRSEAEWAKLDEYREASTKLLCRVPLPDGVAYAAAFVPSGSEVAVAGADGVVRCFDAASGAERWRFSAVRIEPVAAADAVLPLPWQIEASIEPEPTPPGNVTGLTVQPAEVLLAGPFASAQVVVTGTLADGRTIDLTRSVRFEGVVDAAAGAQSAAGAGGVVSIGPGGLLRPRADGAATLRIVHGQAEGAVAATLPVRVEGTTSAPHVDFVRDVNPVLTRLGCNQGTCHGAAKGKNGFKLSLRGYDPVFDVRAFTDEHGSRRVNVASPDDSLMLLKASATVPHVGGLLAKPDDPAYQTIRRWIDEGAALDLSTPRVASIAVSPAGAVIDMPGRRQQFRVVASYTDGTTRDVTRHAFLESGNGEVATADATGLVTAVRRGEAPILVRYEGAYSAVTLTVMGDRDGFTWRQPESWGPIDDLVTRKWQAMQIAPAPLCSDVEFLRRVTLDLTGLPPTASEVKAFLADGRDTRVKRAELVARLVGGAAFVEHWTNKWADLLQVNPKFLGAEGAAGLRAWIGGHVAANTPYDDFAREILTATGSNRENPAAAYFKTLRDPLQTMENTTHLFLGVRFNCNKCHDHPFERWTQDQYYQTAAFFARVELARDPESKDRRIGGTAVEGAKPLWEIVKDAAEGEVTHERTGQPVPPQFPFDCSHAVPEGASRRATFAAWLTSPDNAYFARSYVNRIWGYLFGVGIIDPIDDIRAGNPPTNPALLDHLTRSFIASGFDTRRLLMEICTSRTYGLAIDSSKWNQDDRINYSRALPRRLPAETLFDSLHTVVGVPTRFPGYPAGTRAAALPDVSSQFGGGFLQTFGRPARESACECERSAGVALGPVMALVSGPAVGDLLADGTSELAKLVAAEPDDARLVNEVFLRVLNRPSQPEETAAVGRLMAEITADHESLAAELASAEEVWKVERARREDLRTARIAEAGRALEEARSAYEPRRIELERARGERFVMALAAVERAHATVDEAVARLEAAAAAAPRWQAALPERVESAAKATLETLPDGSVRVSGKEGAETTTITSTLWLPRLTGLRLEALTDPSLPRQGPGRSADGNFVVNEIVVEVRPLAAAGTVRKIAFHKAQATVAQASMGPELAVDGDPSAGRGWAVSPRTGEDHWAVFEAKEPPEFSGPQLVTVRIEQKFAGGKHALGRFRVSFTDATAPLALGVPEIAARLAAIPRERRSPTETAHLAEIALVRDPQRLQAAASLRAAADPVPLDPTVVARAADLAEAEKPVVDDPAIVRLRSDMAASTRQVADRRLTAVQDLAWALINSPAFFFNH